MDRRTFFKSAAILGVAGSLPISKNAFGLFDGTDDAELCRKKFDLAVSLSLQKEPINDVVIAMGKSFLGTPYVAHALEIPGDERLVVNMHGLDCVSFYENSLVLARCIKMNKMSFDEYKQQLQFIRYRGGVIDGYTSRLHYTSDYFYDNEQRGVWKNVTKDLGGIPYVKTIDFMSTHPEAYRQLRERPSLIEVIKRQEAEITKRPKFYVPKETVASVADKIRSGDILGITTNIPGLDTSHTGIAIRQGGALHFMHAPDVGKKVQITDVTLAEYLARNKKQTGIMVVQPNEPA